MNWTLGGTRVDLITDGAVRMDGGAMFGVVPKALWSRVMPADQKNRIGLCVGVLVIRTATDVILVDTGIGSRWSAKEIEIFAIDRKTDLNGSLAALGIGPEDVTIVINTHLHFDHCGGNTIDVEGAAIPAFPNARYMVQRKEYEWAMSPTLRDRASYHRHNYEPIEAAGRFAFVDGDDPVADGVSLLRLPGHTPHMQGVFVEGGGQTLFFPSDLLPTAAHLPYAWVTGYDLEPLVTLKLKTELIAEAARSGWIIVFQHDPLRPAGRVRIEGGRPVLEAHGG